MDAARFGDVIADLRMGLRDTPISEVQEIITKSLLHLKLQPVEALRQHPVRLDDCLVEGDLMVQKEPADPIDKPFGESEALRCTHG